MAKTTFTFKGPGAPPAEALQEMLDSLGELVTAASSLSTVADLVGRTADAHLAEVPEVLVYPLAFLATARESYVKTAQAYVAAADEYLESVKEGK